MESAQLWYHKLISEQPYSKDTRIGSVQVRYGLLLGQAREAVLPWYQRDHAVIQAYDHVESHVICRFSQKTFRQEYARLYAWRAPVYREMGQLEESALQFKDGISWATAAGNVLLRADLLRYRAHISAVQGNELQWLREIEEARKDTQYIIPDYRKEALGMIDYAEAEGYKRLAFNPRLELSLQRRAVYAAHALQCFAQAQQALEQQPYTKRLVAQVSRAQCLIWLDPVEALILAEQLRREAMQFYPTLLAKIDRTIRFAQQRLQLRKSDPLPIFDLDTRK